MRTCRLAVGLCFAAAQLLACFSSSGGPGAPPEAGPVGSSSGGSAAEAGEAGEAGEPDAPGPEAGPDGAGDSSSPDATTGAMGLVVTALPGGASSYTQGSYIESFRFTANGPVTVTGLGYYDASLAGTTQTFEPTPVGLYDMTTNTLLGSTTVQATDAATGIFRFAFLASPIALNTTDTYAVVAVTGTNYYAAGFDYGGQINPSLTWVGFAGYGTNNLTQTTTLVEPNFFWTTTGDIGPNLLLGP